jgi:hypothetical protein
MRRRRGSCGGGAIRWPRCRRGEVGGRAAAAIVRQDRALDLVPAAVPLKATARNAARPTLADTPASPEQEPAPATRYAAHTARGKRRPPAIRYCATPAGRVAYSTSGAGPALLFESDWITHLRGQLELCAFGDFLERLGEFFTVDEQLLCRLGEQFRTVRADHERVLSVRTARRRCRTRRSSRRGCRRWTGPSWSAGPVRGR